MAKLVVQSRVPVRTELEGIRDAGDRDLEAWAAGLEKKIVEAGDSSVSVEKRAQAITGLARNHQTVQTELARRSLFKSGCDPNQAHLFEPWQAGPDEPLIEQGKRTVKTQAELQGKAITGAFMKKTFSGHKDLTELAHTWGK